MEFVKMIAWIFRFANNFGMKEKMSGSLSLKEIENTELKVMKRTQSEGFCGVKYPKLVDYVQLRTIMV